MYGEKGKGPLNIVHGQLIPPCFVMTVELIQAMEPMGVADEGEGKSDRTFVKDKSAKLEAKLERENKKKMVREDGTHTRSTDGIHPSLLASPSKE